MMPDAKYVGGLAEMLRVAERFAEAGVAFFPHNPTGPVCHAADLQACDAAGTLDRLEVQFDETPLFQRLVGGAVPQVAKGVSPPPDGPSLGVRLAQDVLAGLRAGGLELDADTKRGGALLQAGPLQLGAAVPANDRAAPADL